ncbi:MAG: LTA synthase family protein [Gammaproteobacteria bacterium]|nr:LTA synthase family protein [Gammaproteobacteria bacterium]MBU1555433.1 LTA synthase family protein [Gammaproteobacteria bacterium]MBU2069390.1 LTA synthase family protein [Gammaproteobacteria bacterium]MBU2184681.1 LTA synthase family protein [Gammaproteobacteria bacterium]MBU2206534.1 LTA synthase family protein [Gammaproteobacteria bacterium]
MVLLMLLLLSLSRGALFSWQFERVSAAGDVRTMLLQGIRADLIFIGLWLVLPLLLAPLLAYGRGFALWRRFSHVWVLLGLCLVIFVEVSTPQFILQYDIRPNRLYVEYLKYPKEVFSTLWQGYRAMLLGGIALTLILLWGLHRLFQRVTAATQPFTAKTLWLSWPLVVLLVFAAVRSTTEHRPANPALFAITSDALVNSLIINSPYSVFYALYSMRHEARSSEIYGRLPENEMFKLALDWPWLKQAVFNDATIPTLHQQLASVTRTKPLNLVIILQESLGATFVESLGGLPVTPELEKLKHDGWWFEQMYATGTRSVRGIEAVVSGFMPTPAQSVVKLSLAQQNFYTLGTTLSQQGYNTSFIYGGEAHFDNMRSFFTGNDIDQVIDLAQIPNPVFVGSWGASDEDLFTATATHLADLHQQQKPFFSLVFTSSNHTPFEFPDGRIGLYDEPKATMNNAVKYADFALGKFIEQAKKQPYWQDTLFLIVADHDNRVYGNNLVPVEKFHIPALILGADLTAKRITPVASQIDLAPTLLSLMGISTSTPLIGRDFSLDANSPGRAIMQFDQYFALMQEQQVTILRPGQSPVSARYNPQLKQLQLSAQAPSTEQVKRALAQVLLPSYLYRQQQYHLPGAF